MRAISLLILLIFCGCERTPAQRPIDTETTPMEVGKDKPAANDIPVDMFKISDVVFERYTKLGFEKLSPHERVFHCVWTLEAEVNNGGFSQFYFNRAGDNAADTVKSLEAIGASRTANLVRRANALFGEAGPSSDRSARQGQLLALEDAGRDEEMEGITLEFLKYDEPLGTMLEAYVLKNVEAFRPK